MSGRGIDQVLPYSVDPQLFEPHIKNAKRYVEFAENHSGTIPRKVAYDYIWGEALKELNRQKPQVKIINLETSITSSDNCWNQKDIHYRMHPKNVDLLVTAGIDVCLLGNNHVMDWGYDGLTETLDILSEKKIMTAGAGKNETSAAKPAIIETSNGRLLVFSYATQSAGIPTSWKAESNKAGVNLLEDTEIEGVKKVIDDISSFYKDSDRVILSIHWGSNFGYEIPHWQRDFAHRILEEGIVDIIHGHSSHHPKGIELYNERLILYGCGDLINDYEGIKGYEEYRDDLSLLYFPILSASGALLSLIMTPMNINGFRLRNAVEKDIQWLADRLNRECRKLETSILRTDDGRLQLSW
jgi:poly-gamma-glutamate synthesis protein (capsule biosynthesis protein)